MTQIKADDWRIEYNPDDGDWTILDADGNVIGGASTREFAEQMVGLKESQL